MEPWPLGSSKNVGLPRKTREENGFVLFGSFFFFFLICGGIKIVFGADPPPPRPARFAVVKGGGVKWKRSDRFRNRSGLAIARDDRHQKKTIPHHEFFFFF